MFSLVALGPMALPRWVLSDKVDTYAMYDAFRAYRSTRPLAEQEDLDQLYIIDHKSSWSSLVPEPMCAHVANKRICARADCRRCMEGKGGYIFRWYSVLWHEGYCKHACIGAWKPGDPESDGEVPYTMNK